MITSPGGVTRCNKHTVVVILDPFMASEIKPKFKVHIIIIRFRLDIYSSKEAFASHTRIIFAFYLQDIISFLYKQLQQLIKPFCACIWIFARYWFSRRRGFGGHFPALDVALFLCSRNVSLEQGDVYSLADEPPSRAFAIH